MTAGLTGCAADAPPLQRFHIAFVDKLDTVVNLTAWCPSEQLFQQAAARVEQELDRFDMLFDKYNPDSTVARINQDNRPVSSPDIAALIDDCRQRQQRFGGVNIAMGTALSLWHEARQSGVPPSEEALVQALKHASMADVHTRDSQVWRTDEQLTLDFGAVAKGYAAQKIASVLRREGVPVFLLDCGTSTLVCSGCPPEGTGWQVAIRHPDASLNLSDREHPAETLGVISLTDMCVGVSGDYQKYFERNGTYYSHILSPVTGRPAAHYRMVCVLTDSAFDADFFSTALFALPFSESKKAAEEAGIEALWMLADGSLRKTDGFPSLS